MKSKNLLNSFKHAFDGLFAALKSERNLKIHVSMMFFVIIFGIVLEISLGEWLVCIICFGVVIGAELFNTAIETVVDIAMPHKNKKAKFAKDVAASGVLVLALTAAIIGLIIFVPKIITY